MLMRQQMISGLMLPETKLPRGEVFRMIQRRSGFGTKYLYFWTVYIAEMIQLVGMHSISYYVSLSFISCHFTSSVWHMFCVGAFGSDYMEGKLAYRLSGVLILCDI